MEEDFYNYFPTEEPVTATPTVEGGMLNAFVVNSGDNGPDTGGEDLNFTDNGNFDPSGAVPLEPDAETSGTDWLSSFFGALAGGVKSAVTTPAKSGASSGGGSSGGSSSSTSKTTATSTFSNTGITPAVLFGFGALLLGAVYIARSSK